MKNTQNITDVASRRRSVRILAKSVAVLLAVQSAQAAGIFWLGTTDGNFNANNWTGTTGTAMVPTLVPLNNDALIFDTAEASFNNVGGSYAPNNDLTGLTGVSLAITDSDATNDFAIAGNDLSIGAAGIVSNVTVGTGASVAFGGTGITLAAASQFNSVAGLLSVNSVVDNGGNLLTVTGAGNTDINGVISGVGGLLKTGAGILNLTQSNNYGGQTRISVGTVTTNNIDALGTGAALLVDGGTLDVLTNTNTVAAVTLTSGNINGGIGGLLTGTSFAVESGTIAGKISGSGAVLTKTTGGTVTLGATNNLYTGGTAINGGILSLGANGALHSTTGNITFGGGTLRYNTGATTTDYSARFKNSTAAISLDTNGQTVTLAGLIDNTNTAGLTKSGAGTLIISSAAGNNSYTGGTTVTGGILTASRSGTGTFSFGGTLTLQNNSSLFVNCGGGITTINTPINLPSGSATIRIDNANGNVANTDLIITGALSGAGALIATGLNNGNRRRFELQVANPLFSGGVILRETTPITGFATRTRLGIYTPTSLGTGTLRSEFTAVTNAAASQGGLEVPNGNLSNSGTYAGLDVGAGVANAIDLAAGANLNVTVSQLNPLKLSGIISGSGSLTVLPPNVTGTGSSQVGGVLYLTGANIYTGNTNLNVTPSQPVNGSIVNLASVETPGVSGPLGNQLANAAGTILFGGGILQYSAVNQFDYSGRFSTAANQFIKIDTNSQTVTFATPLVSAGGTMTKSGAGLLILTAANTYTGVTTVSAGVLQLENATALPGGIATAGGVSNLTFNGGVVGLGAGNSSFTRSLNTAATVTAVTFTGDGGWAAYGADATVNLGGAGGTVTWAATNGTGLNNKILILGATTATHTVDLQNPIDLGAANRTIRVDNGAATTDGRLTGAISSSGGGLIKTGTGTLNLDNAVQGYNSFTAAAGAGATNINGVLGTAPGLAVVSVTGAGTSLKFGTVSQTLSSLTVGAGATVTFTSGFASFSGGGGGKTPGLGAAVVPEPGSLGLLLVGALGALNRRRRQA
ncbi:MAG: autotransporter-associated beta strand repeat-containing protein [Chthoniobacter sp.]|nr:autotransporter-associated beta strand repeat-containing protein [Chthoniobacter sp.]